MLNYNFNRRPLIVSSLLLFIMLSYGEAKSIIDKIRIPQEPYVTYQIKAISNHKVLPWSVPGSEQIGNVVNMTACRGEYQAASFCVHATRNIVDLRLNTSELKAENAVIDAKSVDIRIVKCWFQAGVNDIHVTKERILVPELLLKDDKLVKVDIENKQNYLRDYDQSGKETYVLISDLNSHNITHIQPKDAAELQPVDIAVGETRQFWITLHVPQDAEPGEYEGNIHLASTGVPSTDLPLRVRILPFTLEKPLLRYSIYYRGTLTEDGKGSISSEEKSPAQYEAEMRNLREHCIDYPTIYQPYSRELLRRVFEIREKVGLPKGPIYTLGIGTGNAHTAVELDALKKDVNGWHKIAKEHGYDEVYVYGIDEAKGERLRSQREAWRAVREAGGKVFVAGYGGTFESMGDILDLIVFAGPPAPQEAKKYHDVNHEIFCYGNPQGGVEQPETFRRNYGILLWRAGYDGAMVYAYQDGFGYIWNDFDHKNYRDHVMAYPTVDGVIDTVEWEGFREGVNDVRYLTTLLKAIVHARGQRPELAEHAQEWVKKIDVNSDLGILRQAMVDWIVRLQ